MQVPTSTSAPTRSLLSETREVILFQDITVTFHGVGSLSDSDILAFQTVTEGWYNDYYAAREETLGVRHVVTNLTVTGQLSSLAARTNMLT